MKKILTFWGVFMMAGIVNAQVTISPTTVFFENNFASFTVINNSPASQDITIDFAFGYPVSDELGNNTLFVPESEDELSAFDLGAFTRAFPRALTLQPGQRQTIRLNARPPANITEGVHWSRLVVTSTPEVAEIGALEAEEVTTQLNLIFRQTIGLYYRNGNVNTVLTSDNVNVVEHDNSKLLVYNINMQGNAPFIGAITMSLFDANNNLIHSDRTLTTVMLSENRNFRLPAEIQPGQYRAVINFENARPDVPANNRFPMQPFTVERAVTVP